MKQKNFLSSIFIFLMIFITSLSFQSCHDETLDKVMELDEFTISLKGHVDSLDIRVDSLENSVIGNTKDIANLRASLDSVSARVKANEENIDSIKNVLDSLDRKITSLENYVENMTVGIITQGTYDPVFGTIETLLLSQKTLCGFVGQNYTEIDEFPSISEDYNARTIEGSLKLDEVSTSVLLNDERGEWLMEDTEFGKIYVSLNPLGADATKCKFELVRTDGKSAPLEFDKAQASSAIITKSLGKNVIRDEHYQPADGNPIIWELQTRLTKDGFNGMYFDWSHFNSRLYPAWDLIDLAKDIKNIWTNLGDESVSKAERAANAISSSKNLIMKVKDGIDSKRSQLPQYAIKCTSPNGRSIVSEANITSVAIKPIGYNLAINFDQVNKSWNLAPFKSLIKGILPKIQEHLPNVSSVYDITVNGTGANKGKIELQTKSGTIVYIDFIADTSLPGFTNEQASILTSELRQALSVYKRISSGTGESFMSRVESYLNYATARIVSELGGNLAYRSVEPMLFTETYNGIIRLSEVMNNWSGDKMTVVFTSPTQEYIVPTYLKYIDVCVDGKATGVGGIIKGTELPVIDLDIPLGKSEIVIQTMDYLGYTITKRYPINRVE